MALENQGVRGAINTASGLAELIVDRLRIRNELCIGDTCVNEDMLKALLSDEKAEVFSSEVGNADTSILTPVKQEPQSLDVEELSASEPQEDVLENPNVLSEDVEELVVDVFPVDGAEGELVVVSESVLTPPEEGQEAIIETSPSDPAEEEEEVISSILDAE